MNLPGVPAPSVAARLGQEVVRERGGVQYRTLDARSLLNRCTVGRMPFEWTVNPYRGCALGCRYCYAAYTHEFLGVLGRESFHTDIYVKRGGMAETARVLRRVVARGERIALGTATDPWQPVEAQERVTRSFLALVAQHRNVRLGVITKAALILRDVDVLARIHARSELSIQVSLTSLRADLLRRLEPWAPPPEVRLAVMRRLVEAGFDVGLGLAPILPGITDDPEDLDRLLEAAAAAGVRRFFGNVLFLRSPTREKYLSWVAREHPRLLPAYLDAYRGRVYLSGPYRRQLDDTVTRLARRHGFDLAAERRVRARHHPPSQIALF